MTASAGGSGGAAGVEDVEVAVGSVTRVESQTQQSLRAADRRVRGTDDAAGNVHKNGPRRRGQVGDGDDAPFLLDDEQAVGLAWRAGQGDRIGENQSSERVGPTVA